MAHRIFGLARPRAASPAVAALALAAALLAGLCAPVFAAPDHGPSVNIASKNMNPPAYPASAYQAGIGGTVFLRVAVDATGTLTSVKVDTSSGHDALDEAAMAAAHRWTYAAGSEDGKPVAGTLRIPVDYSTTP